MTLATLLMTVVACLSLGILATYYLVTSILNFFAHQTQPVSSPPALAESVASGD
jgi:hypothetical protein